MFGNTPVGIIFLDILLLIFAAILIPLLYSIFRTLRDILTNTIRLGQAIGDLCVSVKEITEEMTEARIRDVGFNNEIKNLRKDLERHIQEDRDM